MTEREIIGRFRLVALGFAIFALFVVIGSWINYHQQRQLDKHQTVIKAELVRLEKNQQQITRNQQAIKANLDRIVRLTRNSAAAICLVALAPTQKAQNQIIHTFVATGTIDISHSPECQQAAAKAATLILVEHR